MDFCHKRALTDLIRGLKAVVWAFLGLWLSHPLRPKFLTAQIRTESASANPFQVGHGKLARETLPIKGTGFQNAKQYLRSFE